jgi:hypothetical protein
VYVKPDEAALLRDAVAYVEQTTRPGETVAVVPYYPILHFLAQRPGPHGASYIVWPFPEFADRDRRVIDAMERHGTATVIYNFTEFPAFPPAWEYAPELIGYLVEHFEIDRIFSHHPFGQKLAALRREERREAGVPLRSDGEGARVAIVAEDGTRRAVSAGEGFAATTVWPFRPVIALRPTAGGGRTELLIPLDVPAGAALRTAIGVHPSAWYSYPKSSVRFAIGVEHDGGRDELFSRELDPHIEMSERGWFPIELSLAAYAGRRVRLVLETSTERVQGERLEMGGFGDPRIVASGDPVAGSGQEVGQASTDLVARVLLQEVTAVGQRGDLRLGDVPLHALHGLRHVGQDAVALTVETVDRHRDARDPVRDLAEALGVEPVTGGE